MSKGKKRSLSKASSSESKREREKRSKFNPFESGLEKRLKGKYFFFYP
jgi:hypothetical protein